MPGVAERLALFDWGHPASGKLGYGVVSNQAGVAFGFLDQDVAYWLLLDCAKAAFGEVFTWQIQMCPHAPDAGCKCRKPGTLMLEELARGYRVAPANVLYVGDMESDRQAAENFGCDFMWAWEFFGWEEPS